MSESDRKRELLLRQQQECSRTAQFTREQPELLTPKGFSGLDMAPVDRTGSVVQGSRECEVPQGDLGKVPVVRTRTFVQ